MLVFTHSVGKKKKRVPARTNSEIREIRRLKRLFDIVERGKYMWESTFDAIRDPVMIIGRDYRVARANLAAARRCGHEIRELIGKKCYETFAGRKDICPHCPLAETIKGRASRMVEIDDLMRDGDFNVNSYPLLQKGVSEAGGGPFVVHHYHDITDEKGLQRKLIQTEKMAAIGMLAGGVAHEINNPLAGILAFTQLMRNELPEDGDLRNDLSEIEEAAKRCKKIVEDLLTFARPHREGDLNPLSLEDAIDAILPLARLNLRHRNVTLVTDYEPDTPKVRGSAARLQQVFLNLINNAAQSMKEGGEVTVSLRADPRGKRVTAEVKDQGVGIRKELLTKIFDPFFSTKDRSEGTGLGLSICHSIVAEHGGSIEVESTEGKGSLFRVILPVLKKELKQEQKDKEEMNEQVRARH